MNLKTNKNIMNTQEITSSSIDYHYDLFTGAIIPFGTLDIRTAVKTALEVGENGEWVAEQIEEFADSCGIKISDCDVVYCAYDSILQEARNEIDSLINFDFCNDDAEIYTAGNYMATSYNWSSNAPQKIKKKLQKNNIQFEDLSVKTQWFLTEIKANY